VLKDLRVLIAMRRGCMRWYQGGEFEGVWERYLRS